MFPVAFLELNVQILISSSENLNFWRSGVVWAELAVGRVSGQFIVGEHKAPLACIVTTMPEWW